MKKTLHILVLICTLIFAMLFAASCNKEEIPHEHTYESVFVLPTATENGGNKHTCTGCGDSYLTDEIKPLEFTVTHSDLNLLGFKGEEGENFVIPGVFEDNGTWYRVVAIAENTFWGCRTLNSIEIPDSVITIGPNAFSRCTNLSTVVLGKSLQKIERSTFSSCTSLTSINIPDSVISVAANAFEGCDKIFQIENGVSYVDKWVIASDPSVNSVTLRENTAGIANNAFHLRGNLTSVTIPNTVKVIGESAFSSCRSLTEIVIPDSVATIGDWAFMFCSSLKTIKIPGSVTTIGAWAFHGCDAVTSVVISEGVTGIGTSAFSCCDALISITIPKSVTSIEEGAISDCPNLTSITFEGTVEQWNSIHKVTSWQDNPPKGDITCSDGVAKYN